MKKIFALLLVLMMLLSLAACGAEPAAEDTAADESQSEQEVAVDDVEEKVPDPAPDAAMEEESNTAESEQDETIVEDATEPTAEQSLTPDVTEDKQPVEVEKIDTPASDNSGEPAAPQQPAHQHSYNTSATPATCTTKGYTTYTCECGHSYTADYSGGDGHKYEEVHSNEPVYETVCITRCGHCNADITGNVAEHVKAETLAGNGGRSYQSYEQVIVGYEDQIVGYVCSICGAER